MIRTQIRKQGGAAVMTIPANLMRLLDFKMGTSVALKVNHGQLIVCPVQTIVRKRYSLKELLQGVTKQKNTTMKKNTEWFLKLPSVGREL